MPSETSYLQKVDNCMPTLRFALPALFSLLQTLQGFKLDSAERDELSAKVEAGAWSRVEGHIREAALTRMSRMKDK